MKGAEDIDDDGRGPGEPYEPPDDPPNAVQDPAHVLVDPGGGTSDDRNGSVALESADTGTDGEVRRACQDIQDEVERSRMR